MQLREEHEMGKLVVTEFVTVDGVFEDPGGWVRNRGDGDIAEDAVGLFREIESAPAQFKIDETLEAQAMLVGRGTYEQFFALWPDREGKLADKMNSMPKYVVSTSLENGEWENTTVIGGDDPAAEIAKLKAELDGTILVFASAKLVKLLLDEKLVDELRLMVFPVVLGCGRRLFPDRTAESPLELVEVEAIGEKGVILQTYRPARNISV
jgi:dihydrofolate reductase